MKVLYILALVGSLASIVLGVMNRGRMIELRRQKDDNNRAILTNFEQATSVNSDSNTLIATFQDENKTRSSKEYATKGENEKFTTAEKEDKDTLTKTEDTQKALAETKQKIKDKLGEFGSIEELQAKIDTLKKEIDDQTMQISVLEKEIEVTSAVVADNDKTIGRFREQQTQRDKTIDLGTRVGVINAVNPDYAFVIVNMGKSQGVTTDSRFLVKRGTQLVGKLKITQIEGNLTVADIDLKSLQKGDFIQPGDQVIFDNPDN